MAFLWLDGIREIGQQEIMMMVHKGVSGANSVFNMSS